MEKENTTQVLSSESDRHNESKMTSVEFAAMEQGELGLHLKRKLIVYTGIIAIGVGLLVIAKAAEVFSALTAIPVSVTVIASAKLQVNYQSTQINITKLNIQNGYIDMTDSLHFLVNTNSKSGYLMDFHPIGNLFESVEIQGLGNLVQLGTDGGTVVQRGLFPQKQAHELSFRFKLRPGVQPGTYPWPLQLTIRTLS
jgi:hypothetical protein